jgi:hypothetical protein
LGFGPGDQTFIPIPVSDTLEFVQVRMHLSVKLNNFISAKNYRQEWFHYGVLVMNIMYFALVDPITPFPFLYFLRETPLHSHVIFYLKNF